MSLVDDIAAIHALPDLDEDERRQRIYVLKTAVSKMLEGFV